jgi:iron complex outermembrane receptor protein
VALQGVGVIALAGFLAAPAAAQMEGVLEEIIVTAQKREESLQDVPISVATTSGEKLNAMFSGGEDVLALSGRVPGLYAESSNGRAAPRFYLRGLGNIDFDLGASQPVSYIMDEVVMENVVLKSFPLFDVQNIEVIRGPQGTLFGRNTIAGIVKVNTRRPGDETSGYIKGSFATHSTMNLEGAVGSQTLIRARSRWANLRKPQCVLSSSGHLATRSARCSRSRRAASTAHRQSSVPTCLRRAVRI